MLPWQRKTSSLCFLSPQTPSLRPNPLLTSRQAIFLVLPLFRVRNCPGPPISTIFFLKTCLLLAFFTLLPEILFFPPQIKPPNDVEVLSFPPFFFPPLREIRETPSLFFFFFFIRFRKRRHSGLPQRSSDRFTTISSNFFIFPSVRHR